MCLASTRVQKCDETIQNVVVVSLDYPGLSMQRLFVNIGKWYEVKLSTRTLTTYFQLPNTEMKIKIGLDKLKTLEIYLNNPGTNSNSNSFTMVYMISSNHSKISNNRFGIESEFREQKLIKTKNFI